MRRIQRSTITVVLILILAMPAFAGGSQQSPQSTGLVAAVKELVFLTFSRISPPGGNPKAKPEEPVVTTTSPPAKTQP